MIALQCWFIPYTSTWISHRYTYVGLPGGANGKESTCQCRRHERWVWSLEKGMETHSSILAWRIPWTEEHVGLESIGSQRIRHDWSNLTHIHLQMSSPSGFFLPPPRVRWTAIVAWSTYSINSQWEFARWLRKLKLGLCNNLEWWEWAGGRRQIQEGGTYIHLWLTHVDVWQKSNQYCKAVMNKWKISKYFKNTKNKKK